jgi:uncharacterized delta-60 repeat protein
MKTVALLIALLAIPITSNFAAPPDFRVDPTFDTQILALQDILELAVQSDGKVIIGGRFDTINGQGRRYIARLNTDGTLDPTFTSPFSVPAPGGIPNVGTIKILPDGKLLVAGQFNVGSTYSEYARLNSDGTIDPSMTIGTLGDFPNGDTVEPLPDGKFLLCGSRNDPDPLSLVYRMNADGTRDMSFNATFAIGFCYQVVALPDGKVLMTANPLLTPTGTPVKRFVRLNSDGSKDTSFDPAIPDNNSVSEIVPLPDGKLLVYYVGTPTGFLSVLNVDGSVDHQVPVRCGGNYLPQPDGWSIISGCKKAANSQQIWHLASIRPDGTQDPGFDWIDFSGAVGEIRSGPGGSMYVFGRFSVGGGHRNLVRLIPDNIPAKAKFDFDNDGRSDLSVFRPSDHFWYINRSSAGPFYLQWGLPTDKLAAGDYDNDGTTDIGVYRNGTWHEHWMTSGYHWTFSGTAGDTPLFGDFSGFGFSTRMLRGIRNGTVTWIISSSQRTLSGEQTTDIPIVGDFEGDGRDEIGFFRDGAWYGGVSDPVPPFAVVKQWGIAGDIPVPGDYDGDRQTDYAVFRPSTGVWWIDRSTAGMIAVQFGLNGDIPVPSDYDGDGKTDIAIFRDGVWWQIQSSNSAVKVDPWGVAGDIPIPAQNR